MCFAGRALAQRENHQLDEGIIAPVWLSRDELIEQQALWRSPMVLRCIDDYLAGERFSLELLKA